MPSGWNEFGIPPKDPRRVISKKERKKVLKRQSGKCDWCGKSITLKSMQADHSYPYSWGGVTSVNNTDGLCKSCHKKRTKSQNNGGFIFPI